MRREKANENALECLGMMKNTIANAHQKRNRRVNLERLESRQLLCGENNVFGGLVADRYIALQNTDVVEFQNSVWLFQKDS